VGDRADPIWNTSYFSKSVFPHHVKSQLVHSKAKRS
jgi:hypothetical protein